MIIVVKVERLAYRLDKLVNSFAGRLEPHAYDGYPLGSEPGRHLRAADQPALVFSLTGRIRACFNTFNRFVLTGSSVGDSGSARIDGIVKVVVVGHRKATPVAAEVGRMIMTPDARF